MYQHSGTVIRGGLEIGGQRWIKGGLACWQCSKVPVQTVISCSMKEAADRSREMLLQSSNRQEICCCCLFGLDLPKHTQPQRCQSLCKCPRARPTPEELRSSLYALSHLPASGGCLKLFEGISSGISCLCSGSWLMPFTPANTAAWHLSLKKFVLDSYMLQYL